MPRVEDPNGVAHTGMPYTKVCLHEILLARWGEKPFLKEESRSPKPCKRFKSSKRRHNMEDKREWRDNPQSCG